MASTTEKVNQFFLFCTFHLLAALLLSTSAPSANASNLKILSLYPAPNYALSTDINDKQQLTDGKMENYPIWISRDSVGWQYATPIRIDIALRTPIKFGTIKLHTACGTQAGVFFPRRIDIYTQLPAGNWQYLNTITATTEENCQRAAWISADLQNINRNLALIVHANGAFVFFDEIELTANNNIAPVAPNSIRIQDTTAVNQTAYTLNIKPTTALATNTPTALITNVPTTIDDSALVQDSITRLRTVLSALSDKSVANSFVNNGNEQLSVWQQDPWLSADKWLQQSQNPNATTITLSGSDREIARLCLGMRALTNLPTNQIVIKVDDKSVESAVRIRQLMPVLAATGTRVYDRLPPPNKGVITFKASEPGYAWLDFDLSKFGPGHHTFTINLSNLDTNTAPTTISINLYIVHDATAPAALNVITWSYLDQGPIWSDQSAALAELLSAGTNAFVIHPANIPGLQLDGKWEKSREQEFDKQIKLLSPYGQVFLVLGWTKNNNPFVASANGTQTQDQIKKAYQQWLAQLTRHMALLGLSKQQWALYPIDEPHDSDLELLSDVARYTHEYDPSIRLYANPIPSENPAKQIQLLKTASAEDIALWQPQVELANSVWGYWFRQLNQPFWIYAVPPAPAKTAEPLAFYRALSWQAWQLGASGIGFWAFAETGGSSALDDFDGKFPDWAVVYEGVNGKGVEASRRWEAFKQGIQDYKLFAAANLNRSALDNPSTYDSSKMDTIRAEALSLLQSHNNSIPPP